MRFSKTAYETLYSLSFGRYVRLVCFIERETENPCVVGSIPTLGTTIFSVYATDLVF